MNGTRTELAFLNSPRQRFMIFGSIALIVCLIGAYFDHEQFFHSYLMAYVFWLGVPLGSMAILMIHHLVGGSWGFVIQRVLESAIRTFPIMAFLFLPLFLGLGDLYPWANHELVAQDAVLRQKVLYLNVPFFIIRTVLYFAIWISVAYFLTKWSTEQDQTIDGVLVERLQRLSAPGLVLYGLTVTFSAIDWLMSLEPHWFSTIYGMIFMVSHGLVAMAFAIATSFFLWSRRPLQHITVAPVFQDLGNMLLALVMFWAYLSFSQFLLIWVENLQHETPWYLRRMTGGWGGVGLGLIILQFALPFLLLLSRALKRKTETLCAIAGLIVVMHLIEMFWFVAPAVRPGNLWVHWLDVLVPLGIGALWLSAFFWQLESHSLYPVHDPRLVAIIEEASEVSHGA